MRHSLVMTLWMLSALFHACPNTEGQFEEPRGGISPKYAGTDGDTHRRSEPRRIKGGERNKLSLISPSLSHVDFIRPLSCNSFGSLFWPVTPPSFQLLQHLWPLTDWFSVNWYIVGFMMYLMNTNLCQSTEPLCIKQRPKLQPQTHGLVWTHDPVLFKSHFNNMIRPRTFAAKHLKGLTGTYMKRFFIWLKKKKPFKNMVKVWKVQVLYSRVEYFCVTVNVQIERCLIWGVILGYFTRWWYVYYNKSKSETFIWKRQQKCKLPLANS